MPYIEIKWKAMPAKPPKDWHANYPDAHYQVIHRENYLPFIQECKPNACPCFASAQADCLQHFHPRQKHGGQAAPEAGKP